MFILGFFVLLWSTTHSHILKNWAGNLELNPLHYHEPKSVSELQKIIKESEGKVRVIGTGHTFNTLVDTKETIISLKNFNQVVSCCEGGEAVVGGGITYAQLAPQLEAKGWALPNLASLPHISLVGAAATGTHGSGVNNTGLAGSIKSIRFVDAKGNIHSLITSQPGVGTVLLGALGPIFEITISLVPSFYVKQCVYGPLPYETFYKHHNAILNSAYSVGLFTSYTNNQFTSVWVKHKASGPEDQKCDEEFFGAPLFKRAVHPIEGIDPSATTTQTPLGLWYEKLAHFRHDHTPSAGEELQSEMFVSRQHEAEAFKAVVKVFDDHPELREVVQTSEVRTMKPDGYDLSPCRTDSYGSCLAIHCTLIKDWVRVQPLVEKIQTALIPFNVRPHWGKLFTLPANYIKQYFGKNLKHFQQTISSYDSQGKFLNEFLRKYITEDTHEKEDL